MWNILCIKSEESEERGHLQQASWTMWLPLPADQYGSIMAGGRGGIQGGWGCGGGCVDEVLETKQKAGTDLGTFWKGELGNLGLAGSLNGVGDGGKRVRVTVQISRGFLLSFGPTVAFQRRLRSDSFVKKSNKFERPKLIISLFILTLLATHFVQNSSNISHIYHFCQVSQGSTRISHTLWLILHWREQNYAKLLKVTSIGSMHVRTILYHAIPHKLKG